MSQLILETPEAAVPKSSYFPTLTLLLRSPPPSLQLWEAGGRVGWGTWVSSQRAAKGWCVQGVAVRQ